MLVIALAVKPIAQAVIAQMVIAPAVYKLRRLMSATG